MYRINDRVTPIREIQSYLRGIGYSSYPINTNGVYDDNTRAAVTDFQERSEISATGEVDLYTFERLRDEFKAKGIARRVTNELAPTTVFPLLRGTVDDVMTHINSMMSSLLDYYGMTHSIRVGRSFSKETAEGAAILRSIYSLSEGEEIDEELYFRMRRDRESIASF